MPSKSRHPKGKHPHSSRKSKARQRQEALATQPAAIEKPVQPVEVVAPPPSQPAAIPSKPSAQEYPYISRELRRIGILAAGIIIILIVLAIALP